MTAIARITNAACLSDLMDALNLAGVALSELDGERAEAFAWALGNVMPELPLFGGEAPDDTAGVWSWDAASLLVGEGWVFEIIAREA